MRGTIPRKEIIEEIKHGTTVLDIRPPNEFAHHFIEGAINIGYNGPLDARLETLLSPATRMVIMAPEGKATEAIARLSRAGFKNIIGYWDKALDILGENRINFDHIHCISPEKLAKEMLRNPGILIDVRKADDFHESHIAGSYNLPLSTLLKRYNTLDKNIRYYMICRGGYDSMIACSLLASKGIHKIVNVSGGIAKVKKTVGHLVVYREDVG